MRPQLIEEVASLREATIKVAVAPEVIRTPGGDADLQQPRRARSAWAKDKERVLTKPRRHATSWLFAAGELHQIHAT